MTDPPVKNPDRVPAILQGFDAVQSTGGVGVTIIKETESFMSDTKDIITEDGVYADDAGNQWQYRKGQVLPEGEKATLKKVGPYPEPEATGTAEHEATKAETQPENKAAPKPDDKQRG